MRYLLSVLSEFIGLFGVGVGICFGWKAAESIITDVKFLYQRFKNRSGSDHS